MSRASTLRDWRWQGGTSGIEWRAGTAKGLDQLKMPDIPNSFRRLRLRSQKVKDAIVLSGSWKDCLFSDEIVKLKGIANRRGVSEGKAVRNDLFFLCCFSPNKIQSSSGKKMSEVLPFVCQDRQMQNSATDEAWKLAVQTLNQCKSWTPQKQNLHQKQRNQLSWTMKLIKMNLYGTRACLFILVSALFRIYVTFMSGLSSFLTHLSMDVKTDWLQSCSESISVSATPNKSRYFFLTVRSITHLWKKNSELRSIVLVTIEENIFCEGQCVDAKWNPPQLPLEFPELQVTSTLTPFRSVSTKSPTYDKVLLSFWNVFDLCNSEKVRSSQLVEILFEFLSQNTTKMHFCEFFFHLDAISLCSSLSLSAGIGWPTFSIGVLPSYPARPGLWVKEIIPSAGEWGFLCYFVNSMKGRFLTEGIQNAFPLCLVVTVFVSSSGSGVILFQSQHITLVIWRHFSSKHTLRLFKWTTFERIGLWHVSVFLVCFLHIVSDGLLVLFWLKLDAFSIWKWNLATLFKLHFVTIVSSQMREMHCNLRRLWVPCFPLLNSCALCFCLHRYLRNWWIHIQTISWKGTSLAEPGERVLINSHIELLTHKITSVQCGKLSAVQHTQLSPRTNWLRTDI